jgi:low affinity Fe/Cu permease
MARVVVFGAAQLGLTAGGAHVMEEVFEKVANLIARAMGRPLTFLICCLLVLVWAATGPIFHFSDTWQLVINTGTTIVTFLMVFLIQNTQNRDARAINLKLNELIRSIDKARDQMIDIESLSDLELDELQAKYEKIKAAYTERQKNVRSQNPVDAADL